MTQLLRLSDSVILNVEIVGYVELKNDGEELEADIVFVTGGNRTVRGDAAVQLLRFLDGIAPLMRNPDEQLVPRHTEPVALNTPAGKKAWFYGRDGEGRSLILAFVSREQSSTVRTFDARNGSFIAKVAGTGSYRVCFADLIARSTEVTVPYQPNLDRDCKERLPEPILRNLRQQIEAIEIGKQE